MNEDPKFYHWERDERSPTAPGFLYQCFCVGPKPGHDKCPCAEKAELHRRLAPRPMGDTTTKGFN